jgi:hypothetical protein
MGRAKVGAMSLVFGCETHSGVLLASDSRVTIPNGNEKTHIDNGKKLFFFDRFPAAFGMTGRFIELTAIGNSIKTNGRYRSYDGILQAISRQGQRYIDKHFPTDDYTSWPDIEVLCGYQMTDGRIVLSYTRSRREKFRFSSLRTSAIMIGCQKHFQNQLESLNLSRISDEHARQLACHLILETAKKDEDVGGPIQMCHIHKDGVMPFDDSDIARYCNRQNELIDQLARMS